MKSTLLLMMLAMLLGGCANVQLSSQYSALLDQTSTLSEEVAKRAESGQLTSEQMVKSLRGQATVWKKFQAARDGKE